MLRGLRRIGGETNRRSFRHRAGSDVLGGGAKAVELRSITHPFDEAERMGHPIRLRSVLYLDGEN